METLPLEMVSKISRYLTPQDLARCCGVCHGWREMFNDDCHWRPHCDPALAEQLCNTLCVVEPAFITPEDTNSTLTPIGHWRLAFMREKHLWENWKQGNHEEEKMLSIKNEIQIDFLTNTLVVRWCSDRIEIWDVSITPMAFLSKTDPSVDFGGSLYRWVVGSNTLLVEQKAWLKVFYMDANKCVELKHNIPLDEDRPRIPLDDERRCISLVQERREGPSSSIQNLISKDTNFAAAIQSIGKLRSFVKGNNFVHVNASRSSLQIIDLETGKTKRNEPCPANGNEVQKGKIVGIKSSPTSDNVIVVVSVPWPSFIQQSQCYIYSLRQLTFLQGPVIQSRRVDVANCAIHENYLAFVDTCAVKIYNCHTLELIFQKTISGGIITCPIVFNNSFTFTVATENNLCYLWTFSLSDKILTTICIQQIAVPQDILSLQTINNKFLYVTILCQDVVELWEASGTTLKRSDISVKHGHKINQAFTRGIVLNSLYTKNSYIHYYW